MQKEFLQVSVMSLSILIPFSVALYAYLRESTRPKTRLIILLRLTGISTISLVFSILLQIHQIYVVSELVLNKIYIVMFGFGVFIFLAFGIFLTFSDRKSRKELA